MNGVWLVLLLLLLALVVVAVGAAWRSRPLPPARRPHLALKGTPLGGELYVESECCTGCGVPWRVAPELFAQGEPSCTVKRQPQNAAELRSALRVLHDQDLGCVRYRGADPRVTSLLSRVGCAVHCEQETRRRR